MKKKLLTVSLAAMMLLSAGVSSGCISAAIGIPSVVGIANNANNSTKETNAEQLTSAVKTLYSGVASGTINKNTPADELNGLSSYKLPDMNETIANRKTAAQKLTLQDAVDYEGLASKFSNANIGDYGYDPADGCIYYKGNYKGTLRDLSMSTTLGVIRGA